VELLNRSSYFLRRSSGIGGHFSISDIGLFLLGESVLVVLEDGDPPGRTLQELENLALQRKLELSVLLDPIQIRCGIPRDLLEDPGAVRVVTTKIAEVRVAAFQPGDSELAVGKAVLEMP
jgi:hypothetical protein